MVERRDGPSWLRDDDDDVDHVRKNVGSIKCRKPDKIDISVEIFTDISKEVESTFYEKYANSYRTLPNAFTVAN